MKKIISVIIASVCFVAMFSCNNHSAHGAEAGDHSEEHEHPSDENITSLTPEQIKTIGIQYGSIEQKELSNSIKANGILKVPQQNKAFVTPYYSGVVRTIRVEPGSHVDQGQVIATIFNPDLISLQQQLQQLNIEIELTEKEVARQDELFTGNAAPLKKLQQAEAELAAHKSKRDALSKQLTGMGASHNLTSELAVKAPISGTISKITAQIGSNVDLSSPIAEIVNNSQLHLDLFIYERELPKLAIDQTIHFTITNNPGKEYDATIFSIGTAFEPGTKTIPIHARIKGDKAGLIDGMNITALVSLSTSTYPAIPTSAIMTHEGKDYIFIEEPAPEGHEDEVFFKRISVVKGTTDVGYSEVTVLTKIPEDAKIVTNGAFFILAKMTNTGEHEH